MLSKAFWGIRRRFLRPSSLLLYILVAATGYGTSPVAFFGQNQRAIASITNPSPDPCTLLSSSEIEKVQGEGVTDKKFSQQPGSSFSLRACFYQTSTFAKSISLSLAVPNTGGQKSEGPREFWMKHFQDVDASPNGKLTDKRESETKKEEESEGGSKPVEVPGLGDQAYWIANPHLGTLYVLQDNCFLRISLGGNDSDEVRSSKAKDLARAALVRLKSAPAAHT